MLMLLLQIALLGLIVWAIITYIPMAPGFKTVIIVVSIIILVIYLMQVFGISDFPVPHLRR